jgi:hypothetical protein
MAALPNRKYETQKTLCLLPWIFLNSEIQCVLLLILFCIPHKKKVYYVNNKGYDVLRTLIFNSAIFFKHWDNLFYSSEILLSSYFLFFIIIISKYKNNVEKTPDHSS